MKGVEIEVYRHIFGAVAQEMGATLMRSAFSPNIKERRDYSCAIFDDNGEMVAQAAHIPVHLGSTPMSVAAAMQDVVMHGEMHVLLNDPYRGGTHLPDLTLVSPVCDAHGHVRFFVANRAHHADVGGISPGSLPLSRSIDEEGFRLGPTVWSSELEERIATASRTPEERRGDLRAQLAANRRGRLRLQELMNNRGEALLQAARGLQDYSERFMRDILSDMPRGTWEFEDALDDDGFGNGPIPIHCRITLAGDRATIDFRQSAPQTTGPLNVPRAVTVSAVLYAFRCLAPPELPSNAGYMRCLEILTRPGSILDAIAPAAVALGNVETSQRVVDAVFGALALAMDGRIPAASCGTMNNVMIGGMDLRNAHAIPFAYYETIGGGSGACDLGPGASAIQTHMTNTLNTPVEALEHAYPFRVRSYRIRRGSGGDGHHRGGDGIARTYEFTSPAVVTLMGERRTSAPWGLAGGAAGASGRHNLTRDGQALALAAKCTFDAQPGDVLEIETPGGGGYGKP